MGRAARRCSGLLLAEPGETRALPQQRRSCSSLTPLLAFPIPLHQSQTLVLAQCRIVRGPVPQPSCSLSPQQQELSPRTALSQGSCPLTSPRATTVLLQ